MEIKNNKTFASLFKRYKMHSEIETLSQFGDLLAQEGIVYEDSLFTRWQHGNRVPKERKVLLKIIRVFVIRKGIKTIEEANELLASVSQIGLTKEESDSVGLKKEDALTLNRTPRISSMQGFQLMIAKLFSTKFTYWILALFIAQTIWFIRIQELSLHDTTESYYFNWFYGFIALSAAVYGFIYSRKTNSYLLALLSLGMMSEWFGVQLWFYYNLNGINVPFPSLADIGYAGIIPIYILATLSILNARIKLNRKVSVVLIPIVLVTACYSIFLQTIGLNFMRQLKLLLDFIHPIGEIIPILILIYIVSFRARMDTLLKIQYSALIFALFAQFITDYSFMYADQTNTYVNAGIIDYLYVLSYVLMSLTIIIFVKNDNVDDISIMNHIPGRKKTKNNRIKIALSV